MVANVNDQVCTGFLHSPLNIGGVRYLCGQPVNELALTEEEIAFYKRRGIISNRLPRHAHAQFRHLSHLVAGQPVEPMRTTDMPPVSEPPAPAPAPAPVAPPPVPSKETVPGENGTASANFAERQRRATEALTSGGSRKANRNG